MKNILITGGAGFLGRGIMRQFSRDYNFIVYSRDETKQDICKRSYPGATYVLGDVTDLARLNHTLIRYSVDTIIHAAAIKYIPEAEKNVEECIRVNVDGSRNVAEAAIMCSVDTVIGISTDKACEPINVYGATKMLMERLFREYGQLGVTKFVLTRYGNVVGSTGSVIPLFQKQIEEGLVKVTDPHMTRFWISLNQAVKLIELALDAEPGQMIVPKAQAMTIGDLCEALIEISGEQSQVEIIGPRPGEKRHENLIHKYESVRAQDHGQYYIIGDEVVGEPFVVSSGNPEVWLSREQLEKYMAEAC